MFLLDGELKGFADFSLGDGRGRPEPGKTTIAVQRLRRFSTTTAGARTSP